MKKKNSAGKKKFINDKQLAAYTAAAGAALVAGAPADAGIQYTPADITLSYEGSSIVEEYINIDGYGGWDVNFRFISYFATRDGTRVGDVHPNTGVSFINPGYDVKNLDAGESISAGQDWGGWGFLFDYYWKVNSPPVFKRGEFTSENPGYLGIRFDSGSGINYGWIHIDSISSNYSSYHIDGWAYDDSGVSIMAGQTVVPEPTGLALFAAGAAALSARRKLRRARK